MRNRLTGATLLALVATLTIAASAVAGGWASATLDAPADPPGPGQPTLIRFELLQHGVTPVDFGPTSLTIVNADTGERTTFAARPDGEPGMWVAEVTYPAAGTYSFVVNHELEIGMFGFEPVTISAGGAAQGSSAASATTGGSTALILVLAFLAVMLAVGGLLGAAIWRRRDALRPTVNA
jgi:hypothetical protein